ncbi:hypothetical protein H9Y04_35030 [Streptomyces sp. TRM66268-LWL]|uniref:Lipoprotein n=1 Tax=Streptomyces polyasparticus TaxID=2767826 RepID=A0ABR7SU00_9ACTN|nr:hypothetical protein [Streptomyces polyasparticus]MBC9717758.1 hypothetical protein [Streptomyces polyasparticus]
MRRRTGAVRRQATAVLLAAGALVLAGCGIRATEVPTEFGAAPSRVPCPASAADVAAQAARGLPMQVYLICGSQLVGVDRSVALSDGHTADDRVYVAQALLDELREEPSQAEAKAGFTTAVRSELRVRGPQKGDPAEALRLSTPPKRLASYALAQVVCTLVHGVGAGADSVVLGGPADKDALQAYACTDEVRAQPGVVPVPSGPA